ncbi:MAG: hypothetical protein LUB59_04330 [Candidatus Gastranaerophilales bacterium]|nr:hypothetical protein [Candidatus Gastranaerophilales bacterium]
MGMASSQARLLMLTACQHSIERKAQKVQADKLRLATESDRLYEDYLDALDATKIQYKTLNNDGSISYMDATLNTLENGVLDDWSGETSGEILFMQDSDGNLLITPAIAEKYGLSLTEPETRDMDTFITETTGKTKSVKYNYAEEEVEDSNIIKDYTKIANVETTQPSYVESHSYNTVANIEGGVDYSSLSGYAEFDSTHADATGTEITSETTHLSSGNYIISSAEGLAKLAELSASTNTSNITITLSSDIDMSSITDWSGIENFSGIFDGNGYVISNLSGTNGLFASTNGATIENVGLKNVDISGNSSVGALIGNAYDTNVENCYSTGSVSGSQKVGGLIGYTCISRGNTVTYDNIYSTAEVSGAESVGGLLGETYTYYGNSAFNLKNCYAIGDVSGTTNVGGLAGRMYYDEDNANDTTDIENAYAGGNVTGGSNTGGFVGYISYWGDGNDYCVITNCQSGGNVSGNSDTTGAFAGTICIKLEAGAGWNSEEQKYVNFVDCGYSENSGASEAYGTILDSNGNDVTSLVRSSGSTSGLVSFILSGVIPSINSDGSGDYMQNIIAVLSKAGVYDPCSSDLTEEEQTAMEKKISAFLAQFEDNDTDNTKLWYLNEAINEYITGSGSSTLAEALIRDLENGTITATIEYQTGEALEGSVVRGVDTVESAVDGTHEVEKGEVTIPTLSNISEQLYYALTQAGYSIKQDDITGWISDNYDISNDDDRIYLANLNSLIQNSADLDSVYNDIFSGTKYEDNTLYNKDEWNINIADAQTITVVYGTTTKETSSGTAEEYWDTTDSDIANAMAIWTLARQGVSIVSDEQASSVTWLANMVSTHQGVLTTFDITQLSTLAELSEDELLNLTTEEFNKIMGIEPTTIYYESSLREVSDESKVKKAETEYETELKRIDQKETRYDTQLAMYETEREAVQSEIETLRTVIDDNVERTFKLFT